MNGREFRWRRWLRLLLVVGTGAVGCGVDGTIAEPATGADDVKPSFYDQMLEQTVKESTDKFGYGWDPKFDVLRGYPWDKDCSLKKDITNVNGGLSVLFLYTSHDLSKNLKLAGSLGME